MGESHRTSRTGFRFSIAPKHRVTHRNFLQCPNITRVELSCPLEVSSGLFPAPLTPLDEALQFEQPGIIGQGLASNFEFSQSALIVAVASMKMYCPCEVRFT